jgi:hypothetical protein
MSETAAHKSTDHQRPTEDRDTPSDRAKEIDAAVDTIRADARRAPRTYARDAEVPGGGE